MTDHPITPSPELVQQWSVSSPIQYSEELWAYEMFIAHQAARWGSDQELEACCALMDDWGLDGTDLRFARRPKPPSLKEQALKALKVLPTPAGEVMLDITDVITIRHALEALPND